MQLLKHVCDNLRLSFNTLMVEFGKYLPFEFLFYHIPYLLHRVTFFVKLEGPQGLPKTDISDCGMAVNVTTQQALMPERRRLLAHAKTIDAVQDPRDFLCDLVGLFHAGVVKLSRINRCPCLTLAERFVLCNSALLLRGLNSDRKKYKKQRQHKKSQS
jgi:hypothetical protein